MTQAHADDSAAIATLAAVQQLIAAVRALNASQLEMHAAVAKLAALVARTATDSHAAEEDCGIGGRYRQQVKLLEREIHRVDLLLDARGLARDVHPLSERVQEALNGVLRSPVAPVPDHRR